MDSFSFILTFSALIGVYTNLFVIWYKMGKLEQAIKDLKNDLLNERENE